METVIKDLRYGLRSLLREPAFTLAAVLALGLGTGATTAIFTIADAVVLRPLPYAAPERLVMLWETNHAKGLEHEPISPVNFGDYRALSQVFDDAAAWWRPDLNLTEANQEPIRVSGIETSQNLFRVLGVQPRLGRDFPVRPTLYGSESEVIISDRLWQTRFGGKPAILGQAIRLNDEPYTVIGVMPPGFDFPGDTDVWQGLVWDLARHSRGAHFMQAVARLKADVSNERAQAEIASLTSRLQREFTGTNSGWSARSIALHTETVGFFRPALFVLLGAVGLLLLIACINVANLLLARATAREREVAIRAAIGASRARLVRQLLTESAVLALLGAVVGIVCAVLGVKALIAATPIPIPRLDQVAVDARVLAFTVAVTLATALAFGLVPALFMSSTDLQQTLKEGGRAMGGGTGGARIRNVLVMAEVALAVMLLAGAGLLVRSVAHLLAEEPGFNPSQVLTVNVQLAGPSYEDWGRVERFYSELTTALRNERSVVSAGATNFLPLEAAWRMPFLIVGLPPVPAGDEPTAQHHSVDEGYFSAMRVPVLDGRVFDERDTAVMPPVVIVNQALARQYWPNERAVGKKIVSFAQQIGPLGRRLTVEREHEVVGVVGNVKNTSLQSDPEPAIYYPQRQFPFKSMHLVVRGRGDAAQVTQVIRDAVRRLDPSLPLSSVRTMDQVVQGSVDQPRFLMYLMSGFALIALALAAVGLYGVLSYAVNQRRQEISIRLALGADRSAVVWLVLRRGLVLTIAGTAVGTAGVYVAGRSIASFLYGVSAADGLTFVSVLAIVVAVALAACLVPARRAAGLDPLAGLRAE